MQAQCQQARLDLQSARERMIYELKTFHEPDYTIDEDDLSGLKAIAQLVDDETAAALGPQLLHYLSTALPATVKKPRNSLDATELVVALAKEDAWLVHDVGLLFQRHLDRLLSGIRSLPKDQRTESDIISSTQMFLLCAMKLGDARGFSWRLGQIDDDTQIDPEIKQQAMASYLEELPKAFGVLLGRAADSSHPAFDWMVSGAAEVLFANTGSPSMRAFENALINALDRHRERVKNGGVERPGIDGMHEASLKLYSTLIIEQSRYNERMMVTYLNACFAWINQYVDASLYAYIMPGVRFALEGTSRAKALNDLQIQQILPAIENRCLYICAKMMEETLQGKDLIKDAKWIVDHLGDEAFITEVNGEAGTQTQVYTKDFRERLEMIELLVKVNTMDPQIRSLLDEYQTALALFKQDTEHSLNACIAKLEDIRRRLFAPGMAGKDKPLAQLQNKTLDQETEETLLYAHCRICVMLLNECVEDINGGHANWAECNRKSSSIDTHMRKLPTTFQMGNADRATIEKRLTELESVLILHKHLHDTSTSTQSGSYTQPGAYTPTPPVRTQRVSSVFACIVASLFLAAYTYFVGFQFILARDCIATTSNGWVIALAAVLIIGFIGRAAVIFAHGASSKAKNSSSLTAGSLTLALIFSHIIQTAVCLLISYIIFKVGGRPTLAPFVIIGSLSGISTVGSIINKLNLN